MVCKPISMHVSSPFSPIPTFSSSSPFAYILDHFSSLDNESENESNALLVEPHSLDESIEAQPPLFHGFC